MWVHLQNHGYVTLLIIAQFYTQISGKCGSVIAKWSSNIPLPPHAELKYINNVKIMDEENIDKSG
jgi:hypothetical protein